MVAGSCHGVRKTYAGPGQAQTGVEMLMHRAWVTHHHCPLTPRQFVMGGAGMNLNPKKPKKHIACEFPHRSSKQASSCHECGCEVRTTLRTLAVTTTMIYKSPQGFQVFTM